MLPKERRISKKEFPYIVSNGKRLNSGHFLLYMAELRGSSSSKSRISVSVSKKVANTAVLRNTQRRRAYASVQKHLTSIKPGYFLFFSLKKGGEKLKFESIEKEIHELLSNALMIS